ncbi:hypothetical protein [Formosa sp. 4Alg 33]
MIGISRLQGGISAGLLSKSYTNELLLEVIASSDDNEIQNGATLAIVYGAVMHESKSFISSLKYTKEFIY